MEQATHAQRHPKVSRTKRGMVGGASLLVVAAGLVGIWQMNQDQETDVTAATSSSAQVGNDSSVADNRQAVSPNELPTAPEGVSTVPVGPAVEPSDEEISRMLALDETATEALSDAEVDALAAAAEEGAPLSEDVAAAEAELDEAIEAAEATTPDAGDPADWDAGIESESGAVSLDDLDEEADQLTDSLESWLPDAPEGDR